MFLRFSIPLTKATPVGTNTFPWLSPPLPNIICVNLFVVERPYALNFKRNLGFPNGTEKGNPLGTLSLDTESKKDLQEKTSFVGSRFSYLIHSKEKKSFERVSRRIVASSNSHS